MLYTVIYLRCRCDVCLATNEVPSYDGVMFLPLAKVAELSPIIMPSVCYADISHGSIVTEALILKSHRRYNF